MATTKAHKADKAAEEVAAAELENLKETLGSLEIHPVTGVALDTEDPNYEQLKRMEDLKAEIQEAKAGQLSAGSEQDQQVQKAALDAEEAKLRSLLAQAQASAKTNGVSSIVDNLNTQEQAAKAAADAANGTDGK